MILVVVGALSNDLRGQEGTHGPPLPVVMQVMNYHFTMGRKIPSVFLKILSDGTVECYSL
jgi:hypothetical protein